VQGRCREDVQASFVQAHDLATAIISKHVGSVQERHRVAAIDVPAGDGTVGGLIPVFRHGERETGSGAALSGEKTMCPFHDAPAVIVASFHHVDFFPFILSHVRGPQGTRLAVKRKSPGITESQCEDGLSRLLPGERIVGGNAVPIASINVNS